MTANNVLPFRQKEKFYASDNLTLSDIIGDFLATTIAHFKKPKPDQTGTLISFGKHYRYLGRGNTGYFSFKGRVE